MVPVKVSKAVCSLYILGKPYSLLFISSIYILSVPTLWLKALRGK